MVKFLRGRRGQNTAEYAILIALVIGAAIAMQTYLKRGLQAGIKFAVDKSGKEDGTGTAQYEPYYLESEYKTTQQAYTDTEETEKGGKVTRQIGAEGAKTTTRTGYQTLKAPE